MRVAERVDGDAGERVEIFFALLVGQPGTAPVNEGDRQAGYRCSSGAS